MQHVATAVAQWSKYVSLRNEVVQLLRQSKKNHLKKCLSLAANNSGKQ